MIRALDRLLLLLLLLPGAALKKKKKKKVKKKKNVVEVSTVQFVTRWLLCHFYRLSKGQRLDECRASTIDIRCFFFFNLFFYALPV